MSWLAIALLGAGSYALKAAGPLLLPNRSEAGALTRLSGLLTPALLGGLIAVQTFGDKRDLVLDGRAVGLVVAGIAVWLKAPFVVVVVLAAAASAAVHALL